VEEENLSRAAMDLVLDLVYSKGMVVNVHEAKTQFSKLLGRVILGEEIVIAKSGKPIARLVPIAKKIKERIPGIDRGKIRMAADFDAPLPKEILDTFYR
jgi:prevent-host-death family protein